MNNYNLFVHQMWIKNCIEREYWGQPTLTKEEYTIQNSTFLEDSYWLQEVGSLVWSVEKSDYVLGTQK